MTSFPSSPAVALTIAGSDCSAGAGIQADLKTFSTFGVHGLTALTCVVNETANIVEEVLPLPPEFTAGQVRLLLRSFPVAAIKTGMLFSADHIRATIAALGNFTCPLVVDPVMMASTGTPLIEPDAIELYRSALFPLATLITPNLDEAAALLQIPPISRENLVSAALELHHTYGCAILLKGGHLRDGTATDVLVTKDSPPLLLDAPYIEGFSTHGTGCTYSAAITAGLAAGLDLPTSVRQAKEFITHSICHGFSWYGANTSNDRMDALNQISRPDTLF